MPYYLGIDTATGFVTRRRFAASVPEVAGITWAEVSEAIYLDAAVRRHPGDGPLRLSYDGTQLVEQSDNRPIIRFSSTDATDEGNHFLIQKVTGSSPSTITVELVNEAGNVRTNVTTSRQVQIAGRAVTVSVVAGVGNLSVPTAFPRDVRIDSNNQFRVVKPIRVVVTESAPYADSEL